jgi:hypothetical protein
VRLDKKDGKVKQKGIAPVENGETKPLSPLFPLADERTA